MTLKNNIRPYWPRGIEESEKIERLNIFFAQIYPIHAGITKRDDDADKSGDKVTTIDTMHKCDWAIFDSGFRPDRDSQQHKNNGKMREQYNAATSDL